MSEPWFRSRLAPLDFETSGIDPHEAIIVTAHLNRVGGGRDAEPTNWVLSPGGLEIPAEAAAIHGYSTERARAEGVDHRVGVDAIAAAVAQVLRIGIPLVGHNLGGYDLTVLDAECRRWDVEPVLDRVGEPGYFPVLDTMVLDKHVAPFRKRVSPTQGPYMLRTSAETYELGWNEADAHGAEYDALMSARVAYRIGVIAHAPHRDRPDWVRRLRTQYFDDLAGLSLNELHKAQEFWAAEQAADFQMFKRRTDPDFVIDGSWPVLKAVTS